MGLYRISDGSRTALAASGPLNPIEYADVRTTAEKLGPIAEASGGGVFWVGEDAMPDIRRVSPGRSAAGHGWLGLRRNGDYVVTGFGEVPLLPGVAALLLAIGLAYRRVAARGAVGPSSGRSPHFWPWEISGTRAASREP